MNDPLEYESYQESQRQALQDIAVQLRQMLTTQLHRLADYYAHEEIEWVFWRLQYQGWHPEHITIRTCLHRLALLLFEYDDPHIIWEARCDLESRLYQGRRCWL